MGRLKGEDQRGFLFFLEHKIQQHCDCHNPPTSHDSLLSMQVVAAVIGTSYSYYR